MFRSLTSKIVGIGLLMAASLLSLAALLMLSSIKMEEGYNSVEHTQEVLERASRPVDLVRQAESELRGFVIGGDPSAARDAPDQLQQAQRDLDALVALTRDNPVQNRRAMELRDAVNKRVAFLQDGLRYARTDTFPTRPGADLLARNRAADDLMRQVDERRAELVAAEQALFKARGAEARRLFRDNRAIVLFGVPVILLLIATVKALMIRAVLLPTQALVGAMETFDTGATGGRLDPLKIGSREFAAIARRYNAMADRLESAMKLQRMSESELQEVNMQLQQRGAALEARSAVVERLGAMSQRLGAVRSDEEFIEVVRLFGPQILPQHCGAVYSHSNSRNHLVRTASWGDDADLPERFEPDACWALRLGQRHEVGPNGRDIGCEHVSSEQAYTCEPLLAGGEVIGLVHTTGVMDEADRFRLDAFAGEIASALLNHKLQRDLREQTIRDPLTGLFNRRYMEETLSLEVARAVRAGSPLTVVMCDVDHFKRFNDEHGHEAGDAVLRTIAAEMLKQFRDGDVVCRFGGEEFTVIAPGATPEVMAPRVERLRLALGNIRSRLGGEELPASSMSFGLAGFDPNVSKEGSDLIQLADEALYRAKRAGRDRAVIAEKVAA
jgi:diguanylate cyclase (GGDEF)-like protein